MVCYQIIIILCVLKVTCIMKSGRYRLFFFWRGSNPAFIAEKDFLKVMPKFTR